MTFSFECQWLHWFRPGGFNWVNFTFIHADFEWNRSLGDIEFSAGLLGFTFYWSHNYDRETELRQKLEASMEQFSSERFVLVPADEFKAFEAYRAQLNPPKENTGD
jgi:hypothetical protein